jgi:hypothetical protein
MAVFLLAFLFVIVIPLAEGGLLALFLRDLYNKHPLPLGEIIGIVDEDDEAPPAEPVARNQTEEPQQGFIDAGEEIDEEMLSALSPLDRMKTSVFETQAAEAQATEPQVDVFADAGNIPTGVPVDDALNAMLAPVPTAASTDMDDIVQKPATDDGWKDLQNNVDDEDAFDESEAQQIESLLETMPQNTVNLEAELQDHPNSEVISATAQELLGTDFDVDALMAHKPSVAAATGTSGDGTVAQTVMEEPAAGFVRASSIPTAGAELPAESEVIMPTFSVDFVQDTPIFAASESVTVDMPQLFFTEELKPMFSRKRRT